MYSTSSHFSISCFRHRTAVWMLLAVFLFSFVPAASFAQQPTAAIKEFSGNVLASGQAATDGTVLQAGDTIHTQDRASATLELSDGSTIELGENTELTLTELTETATGARISTLQLSKGRVRALLSAGYQQEGAAFTVKTRNARIDATFSQPDIEVSYDIVRQETIGKAHTVALMAKNLLTDDEMLVPVGSSVIIAGTTIKLLAGALTIAGATEAGTTGVGATSAASSSSSAGSSGMGTGTKVAIGAGAAAAVAGVIALAGSSSSADDNDGNNVSFSGTFRRNWDSTEGPAYAHEVYTFVQDGSSVSGTYEVDEWAGCANTYTVSLLGTVNGEELFWSWPTNEECCVFSYSCAEGVCQDSLCTRLEWGRYTAMLLDNGNTLDVTAPPCTPVYNTSDTVTCRGSGREQAGPQVFTRQ